MTDTVYILTVAQYDERRLVAAFETEDAAERVLEEYRHWINADEIDTDRLADPLEHQYGPCQEVDDVFWRGAVGLIELELVSEPSSEHCPDCGGDVEFRYAPADEDPIDAVCLECGWNGEPTEAGYDG